MIKVSLSGVIVDVGTSRSSKTNKEVPVLSVFSGGEIVKVFGCPFTFDPYESVMLPCKLYNGQYGLRFVYDE